MAPVPDPRTLREQHTAFEQVDLHSASTCTSGHEQSPLTAGNSLLPGKGARPLFKRVYYNYCS